MRLQQIRISWWVTLVWLLAGSLPAWAVQATLVADAHVNSALPAVNSGAISNLNVGAGYTALVQFDLGTLPTGTTVAQVNRAVLLLYCNRVNAVGTVSVQSVGSAWGEYSVTYAMLPGLGSAVQTIPISQAGAYVAVDVTALVQGWLTTPASNHGLALTSAAADVQFDSKENDQTGHAPMLDITLATSGPAGPQGVQGLAGAPGAIGATGGTGPAGPMGVQGPKGDAGMAGPIGPAGPQGLPGLVGPQGFTGSPGLPGTVGATGPVGPQGPIGDAGPVGPVGMSFQGPYSAATRYGLGDGVLYGGAGYVSLVANNQGNAPNQSSGQWAEFASGGAGPAGPAGLPGPMGAIGPMGLAGTIGPAGPSGPSGMAATVSVGSVATGVAGSQVVVTNGGTPSAAVLNFTIPRGEAGTNGTGGGGASSGILPVSVYHAVSFSFAFYSLSGASSSAAETQPVLTWMPNACTATTLSVYSQQANPIMVRLRQGMPGAMTDTGLVCSVGAAGTCSITGSVPVAAGSFVDLNVTGADGNPAAVWTALGCS